MTKLPQVSHERVVRALKRAGFYILREGKHISMTDDKHLVIIPRQFHVITQLNRARSSRFWTQPTFPPNNSKTSSKHWRFSLLPPLTSHVSRFTSSEPTGTNCPRPKWAEWPRASGPRTGVGKIRRNAPANRRPPSSLGFHRNRLN